MHRHVKFDLKYAYRFLKSGKYALCLSCIKDALIHYRMSRKYV